MIVRKRIYIYVRKGSTFVSSLTGLERLPGVADRPNLGYTEAVLHESMRMSSVAPSGLFHETMCDTEICKILFSTTTPFPCTTNLQPTTCRAIVITFCLSSVHCASSTIAS